MNAEEMGIVETDESSQGTVSDDTGQESQDEENNRPCQRIRPEE